MAEQSFMRVDEVAKEFHSFRVYPEHMRAWISDIKEGESAFSRKPAISTNASIGTKLVLVFTRETISLQVRTRFIQVMTEFSSSEN